MLTTLEKGTSGKTSRHSKNKRKAWKKSFRDKNLYSQKRERLMMDK